MNRTAALALTALLGLGCASTAPSDPAPPPRLALGEEDFARAAEDLAQKLRERGARGWPSSVALAGDPPRPVVRLVSSNRTRELIDMRAFDDRVAATLSAAGAADLAAGSGVEGALVIDASISDEVTDTPDTRRVDYQIQFLVSEPAHGGVLASSRTHLARVQSKEAR